MAHLKHKSRVYNKAWLFVLAFEVTHFALALLQDRYASTFLDELLCVLLLPAALDFIFRGHGRAIKISFILFIFYAVVSITCGTLVDYGGVPQPRAAFVDTAQDAKLFFAVAGFAGLLWRAGDAELQVRRLAILIMAIAAINSPFVIRDLFSSGVGLRGQILPARLGLWQPFGLLLHQTESSWLSMLGTFSAFYLFLDRKQIWLLFAGLVLGLLTILHLSTKEVFATLVGTFIIFFGSAFRRPEKAVLLFVASAASVALLIGFTPIGDLVQRQFDLYASGSEGETARTALSLASVQISRDYFPFGTGGGTFASAPSYSMGYSYVYYDYGLANVWGASPEMPDFLQDVFWPKLLAQGGVVGLLLFSGALFSLCGPIFVQMFVRGDNISRYCSAVFTAILFISTASAPFTNEFLMVTVAFMLAFGHVEHFGPTGVPRSCQSVRQQLRGGTS